MPRIDARSQPERSLRVLVVFAHPLETSFVSALHARVVEMLRAGGHITSTISTLYAEKFDPVMSREGLLLRRYERQYARGRGLRPAPCPRAAEALVLVFPVWPRLGSTRDHAGVFPARVSRSSVSVRIDEAGPFHPNLRNIKRMAAVCAYGESRRHVAAKGGPAGLRFVRDKRWRAD